MNIFSYNKRTKGQNIQIKEILLYQEVVFGP